MAYQIVGADEIVGDDFLDDDVDALLGAAPQRRNHMARQNQSVQVRRSAPPSYGGAPSGAYPSGQPSVQSYTPGTPRKSLLGVNSTGTVAAGASVVITVRPQMLFRPNRLLVPDAIAPSFTIDDIKIGNRSQFASSGAIPAAAFGESVDDDLLMDTIQTSQDIVITVTNVSGGAVQFRAALFGDSMY